MYVRAVPSGRPLIVSRIGTERSVMSSPIPALVQARRVRPTQDIASCELAE